MERISALAKLTDQYGWWGEHPKHPVSFWQTEVEENSTRLGYWAWVIEREGEDGIL